MIPPTTAQQLAWITQWRSAAVELARVRQSELAGVDLARVAADLEDACVASARDAEDTQTSGLVDQQWWLHKRRRE